MVNNPEQSWGHKCRKTLTWVKIVQECVNFFECRAPRSSSPFEVPLPSLSQEGLKGMFVESTSPTRSEFGAGALTKQEIIIAARSFFGSGSGKGPVCPGKKKCDIRARS